MQNANTRATDKLVEQSVAVKEDLRELGRLTNEVAREKLVEAKQKTSEMVQRGVDKLGEGRSYLEECVREKPLQYIAMAAGAGILLGFLFAGRRSRV